jgi:hypothetical protein
LKRGGTTQFASQEYIMDGDKLKVGPADAALVNVTLYNDILYWTSEFRCTPNELRDAVKAAGSSAAAVREYLARQR